MCFCKYSIRRLLFRCFHPLASITSFPFMLFGLGGGERREGGRECESESVVGVTAASKNTGGKWGGGLGDGLAEFKELGAGNRTCSPPWCLVGNEGMNCRDHYGHFVGTTVGRDYIGTIIGFCREHCRDQKETYETDDIGTASAVQFPIPFEHQPSEIRSRRGPFYYPHVNFKGS